MKTVINIINNKNKNTNWLPDINTFLISKNEKFLNTDVINQNTIKILLLINFLSNIFFVPNPFALFLIILMIISLFDNFNLYYLY